MSIAPGSGEARKRERSIRSIRGNRGPPRPDRGSGMHESTQERRRNGLWQPEKPVSTARHVRLFRNGRNQAVRIPREFELPGEEAILRKEGARLVLEPVPPSSLLARLATLKAIDEEWPKIVDRPPDDVEL